MYAQWTYSLVPAAVLSVLMTLLSSTPPTTGGAAPAEHATSSSREAEVFSNANFVNDLAYDRTRQVVWAATSGGAVRWAPDGSLHRKYTILDGLPTDNLTSVAVDSRTGDVWFGTRHGAVLLRPDDSWHSPYSDSSLPFEPVEDLAVDPASGDVWFATWGGLVWRQPSGRSHNFFLDGEQLVAVAIDSRSGDVWATGEEGVWRLTRGGDQARIWSPGDGFLRGTTSIAVDSLTGRVWVGTTDNGVEYRDPSGFIGELRAINGVTLGAVYSISSLNDAIWLGTAAGLFVTTQTGVWRHMIDDLNGAAVTSVTTAVPERLWLGLQRGRGVAIGEGFGRWRVVKVDDQVPSPWIMWMDFDITGRPLAVVSGSPTRGHWWSDERGEGLYRREADGSWHLVWDAGTDDSQAPPAFCEIVSSLEADRTRRGTWFVVDGCENNARNGTYFLDEDGMLANHTGLSGPTGKAINGITVHGDSGAVWFLSESGASRLAADDTWTHFTTDTGLINNDVLTVVVDSFGDTWFGTIGGASRLTVGGRWVHYTVGTGLQGNTVLTIVVDSTRGDVWMATSDEPSSGLPADNLTRVAPDGSITSFDVPSQLDCCGRIAIDDHRGLLWLSERWVVGDVWTLDQSGNFARLDLGAESKPHGAWVDENTLTVWLVASDGVYNQRTMGNWRKILSGYDFAYGLENQVIGDIWLTTLNGGLVRIPHDLALSPPALYLPLLHTVR